MRRHEGNPRSGGHLHGLGRPEKIEFPQSWDEDAIADGVIAVAQNPRQAEELPDGTWRVHGTHRDVVIRVYVRPSGMIEAAHPISGPGVRRNPKNGTGQPNDGSTHPMAYSDFVDLAAELVNAITDRIPEHWRGGIAGEVEQRIQYPAIFMRNLVLVLDKGKVPITAQERDTMVRLMNDEGMDLDPVRRFNVTNTAGIPD